LNQRRAADPAGSAFVAANAGAGKTRVLTDRVARLLLAGTAPEKILCITFTKAAAAEMADRLFETLGKWALDNDEKLLSALDELEGGDAKTRDADDLAHARRLFARALETPGGLKIQTIHAFCEGVLRRFPLEAGAPPGFAVMEDAEAARLLQRAVDTAARTALSDEGLGAAFTRLAAARDAQKLRELIISGVKKRLDYEAMLKGYGGLDGALAALARELNVDPAACENEIRRAFADSLDRNRFDAARAALAASGVKAQNTCAAPMAAFLKARDIAEQWAAVAKLFIKTNGEPRSKYGDKTTERDAPWVGDHLLGLEREFLAADGAAKALATYRDTAAYFRLVDDVGRTYGAMKAGRATLDFDDLILRTEALFKNAASDWIMYKLDKGIDHVLIDEAQDTSPAQWEIIEALLKDWLSGAGAREAPRSFFAVGDMKQSIYSFQGANAELFEEKGFDLGKKLHAVTDYHNFQLALSFRSTAPVLDFVDALFVDDGARGGFGEAGVPPHGVNRKGEEGLVEIWPLAPRPEKPETNPWDAPLDAPTADHPSFVLAERVAACIKSWLDDGERLSSRGRKVAAGDIMILVQSRGALFDNVIGALARKSVPVAGADRLKLMEDPAVEDLVSYGKFAASEGDDLSLAETLKSPLFGFDDDEDLFPLAYGRNQSLWRALVARSEERPKWDAAREEIAIARAAGLRLGPYAFLSHVLETGNPSGYKRFTERLGPASREAIDEMLRQALEFEKTHPKSLSAFLDWFEENAGEIKREMERADDVVRVLTVHGAKGLEADIVFLLDAHRRPYLENKTADYPLPRLAAAPGREKLRVLLGGAKTDAGLSAEARADAKRKAYEEYRRLFYVAATRARDRLYVCGIESGNDKNPRGKSASEKSWHALALDAFDRLGERVEPLSGAFWDGSDESARRISCPQTAPVEEETSAPATALAAPPAWLFEPAKFEPAPKRLSPSRLADEDDAEPHGPTEGAALSPVEGGRYFRGRILHRLLELLPELPVAARAETADRLLARLAPQTDRQERARWRDEALGVIADARFADAFAPGSRAEVAIAGRPKGAAPGWLVMGQIDRLAVKDKEIIAIDYKTNRPPPKTLDDIPPGYVAQMAAYRALLQEIYPDHQITTALLWTFEARLTALPESMLDHAFARYVAAG
jgi:ATP-dependent helicase/nuclease subunit A